MVESKIRPEAETRAFRRAWEEMDLPAGAPLTIRWANGGAVLELWDDSADPFVKFHVLRDGGLRFAGTFRAQEDEDSDDDDSDDDEGED